MKFLTDFKTFLLKTLVKTILGHLPETSIQEESFDSFRIEAAERLADQIPLLFPGESCPSITRGVFSWQKEFSDSPQIPAIDLVFTEQGLLFCLYPRRQHETSELSTASNENACKTPTDMSPSLLLGSGNSFSLLESRRRRLESLFRNHLRDSQESVPLIPIFCDPEEILNAQSLRDLSFLIEESWQEGLRWSKSQLPSLSLSRTNSSVRAGSPAQRRLWIEEVSQHSLLPILK